MDKDNLTGFYGEKALRESLDIEILRAERYCRDLTFILFEFIIPEKFRVDMYFPIFKRIAKEIRDHSRRLDLKFRIGNRILLVLPETGEEGARVTSSKISQTLSAVEFYHPLYDEYFHIGVKSSLGVYPQDGTKPTEILKKLEERLR